MKSAASFRQKRCRFLLCALALLLAFPAAGGDGGQRRQPSGVAGETPREVAASLGMGWNLGNQMDAFADGVAQETVWGNPPVGQAFFDSLSAAGFTSVRIPVTWMGTSARHRTTASSRTIWSAWPNLWAAPSGRGST